MIFPFTLFIYLYFYWMAFNVDNKKELDDSKLGKYKQQLLFFCVVSFFHLLFNSQWCYVNKVRIQVIIIRKKIQVNSI